MSREKSHSFVVSLAVKYGVEKAILINHIQFMLDVHKQEKYAEKFHRDGRVWMYASGRGLVKNVFPYFSERSVSRWLDELTSDGVLLKVVGDYNDTKYDNTAWYSVNSDEYDVCQIDTGVCQIGRPIPIQHNNLYESESPSAPHLVSQEDEEETTFVEVDREGEEILPSKKKTTDKKAQEAYEYILKKCESHRGAKFLDRLSQYKALKKIKESSNGTIKPDQVVERFKEIYNPDKEVNMWTVYASLSSRPPRE